MKKCEKYIEICDNILKKVIEKYYFKESFIKDFWVSDIVKLDKDKWLIKLKRRM